jgi:chromate transporter
LVQTTIAKDRVLWPIFGVSALVTAWTESEIIWLFVVCGLVSLFIKAPPRWTSHPAMMSVSPWGVWLLSGLHGVASSEVLGKIALYFAQAGAVVFGSGLAIVPFLHGGVVNEFHWLTEQQFLDAVAVAMITPGPVVITVAFIGYLVAGPAGALVAAIAVFLPCYLLVVIPAKHFRHWAQNLHINAFIIGVTAAATGAIAGAAFVLGKRAIFDVPTVLIALATLVVLTKTKKIPEPLIILTAGMVGMILHSVR